MAQKPLELPEEDPQEIMELVARLAPKLESEKKTVQVLVLGDGHLPPAVLEHLHHLCRERGVDLVIPPVAVDELVAPRREVLLDAGPCLAELVSKMIREMRFEPEPCTETHFDPPSPPSPPKQRVNSFKQFQNNRQNHGPSVRRQFAQIRPPRRGGR